MLEPLTTSLPAECACETQSEINTASLADRVRAIVASHEACVGHARGMLAAAIATGMLLIPLRDELRKKRQWLRCAREDLPFSITTTQRYIRIAEHRTEIESKATTAKGIILGSIRGALRLIAKPKMSGRKPPRAKPTLQDLWSGAPIEERRAVLGRLSLVEFLDSMPVLLRRRFEASAPAKAEVKKAPALPPPDLRASETLRRAISLARSNNNNQFEAAEAMAALRALDRMFSSSGVTEIDEITLIRKRCKARRRAAA
jgi:hypothetical protein